VATLTTQQITFPATEITLAAAAGGGDKVRPDAGDRTFLWVKNGGGSSITVTVAVPGSTYGQANPDVAETVDASGEALIAIPHAVADPTTGLADITYSGVTSVTVAAVRR
jgi:hypothetical protein